MSSACSTWSGLRSTRCSINLMTHSALLFEFITGVLALVPAHPPLGDPAGILLHLGIRPVLNIPGFGEAMVATYLTFLAPDELNALLRRLDPRAALARLASVFSLANFWPAGRQVSIPAPAKTGVPTRAG